MVLPLKFSGVPYVVASVACVVFARTAPAHNGAVAIAYPVEDIAVDGNLDDWPAHIPSHVLERVEFGNAPKDNRDTSGGFRIGYNIEEGAIYVALRVKDESRVVGGTEWNSQDNCVICVDSVHSRNESDAIMYVHEGDEANTLTTTRNEDEGNLQVVMGRTDEGRVYEWRVHLGDAIDLNRSLGFDVFFSDKDEDGSFTCLTWGSGMNKGVGPSRIGDVLLLKPNTEEGRVIGRVGWAAQLAGGNPGYPKIAIVSLTSPDLWVAAECDEAGAYAVNLPTGAYVASPLDNTPRVIETSHIHFQVQANQEVRPSLLRIWELPEPQIVSAQGLLHREQLDVAQLESFVHAYMDYYRIPGLSLAVVKDSEIVYRNVFGTKNTLTREPVEEQTLFQACSMTKPVFACAVMRLVEQGILELDRPLHEYHPSALLVRDVADDERLKLITARHVLAHRTGFPNWRRSNKLTIQFTPGTRFGYSGEGFAYLGEIVTHVTNKDLTKVLHDEVFTPYDIKNAYLTLDDTLAERTAYGHVDDTHPIPHRKPGRANMASSLHIDAENYAKFLIAVLSRNGLSEASYNEMLSRQFDLVDHDERPYGLGFVVEETPLGRKYGHSGKNPGFTCHFAIYDDQGMGYVFFVNNEKANAFNEKLEAFLITGQSG